MYMYKLIVLLLAFVALVKSDKKCGDRLQCFEQNLIRYIDRLDKTPSLSIFGDFLVLEKTEESDNTAKTDEGLIDRCVRYLSTHQLKVKMPSTSGSSMVDEARNKKLRRMILPLLLLLKLKAAIVLPAVLSIIALVAFKGLGAGLVALTIAGATGLKSILEGQKSKLTYEVVPQLGPWSRAGFEGYHTIA